MRLRHRIAAKARRVNETLKVRISSVRDSINVENVRIVCSAR